MEVFQNIILYTCFFNTEKFGSHSTIQLWSPVTACFSVFSSVSTASYIPQLVFTRSPQSIAMVIERGGRILEEDFKKCGSSLQCHICQICQVSFLISD